MKMDDNHKENTPLEDQETTENTDQPTENQEVSEENPSTEETQSEPSDVDKIAGLEAEVAEFKDKYLRLYSDFENFRRRTNKERVDVIQSASKDVMKDILPILDDFVRAKKALEDTVEDDFQSVKEGYEFIHHKLYGILEKKGLKRMPSSTGEKFDVEKHQAIAQNPAVDEEQKGKIIDEIENGYMLGEKVLRFAKVVVAM